jgi:hypothetical protein
MEGEMQTKLSKLKEFMQEGMWGDAILLAAKFGDLGAEKESILKAREGLLRPTFQRQIGRDPNALIDAGVDALTRRYGND